MPLAVRLLFAQFGLVVAVYGLASLTGGWLGMPPWTVRILGVHRIDGEPRWTPYDPPIVDESRRTESDRISGAVGAVGLALVAFAAWPRRGTTRPPSIDRA